jgi:alpha-1,3-rhamnosyltransferase
MEQPLISIIMPSYNHSQYVVYALDSVLREDYPNKEIVIIDDGSTDNSVEIIQNWVDKNKLQIPVTFKSRSNKGFIPTLNELLDIANGTYIALLASDDAFCNNGLTKRMRLLQQTKKMVAVGDCRVIDEDNLVTHQSWMKDIMKRDVSLYDTEEGIMKEILVNPAFSGAVLLIDRNVYKKIGKYPKNVASEDIYFYQRCAANKDIVYSDVVVSEYRRHGTNTSGGNFSKRKYLTRGIIKSYRMNWIFFPGLKMKALALKQWLKWNYMYLRTYILKIDKI